MVHTCIHTLNDTHADIFSFTVTYMHTQWLPFQRATEKVVHTPEEFTEKCARPSSIYPQDCSFGNVNMEPLNECIVDVT